jgi:NAD(P)-dependent dehydrogenase (short-subunit alcohol dehydrogenase family)
MIQKVCLITGGGGFLGGKYCEFFSKNNYKVLCIDNNKEKLDKIKSLNLKNVITFKCDISNNNKVDKLFKKINKSYFVTTLINNAAIDAVPFKQKGKIQKFPSSEMWDKEMDVSLKGSFLMIKYFGEEMIKRKKGSIINIGSDLSVIAPNQKIYRKSYKNYIKPVTYSVIKHGMLGLTKYFASLYGKDNVRVNMVSPGPIKNNQSNELLNELKNIIPMNRLGNYNDLFGLLLFLSNEDSTYMTGQNMVIDGGRTII